MNKEQAEYDENRTEFLKEHGLTVLRFTNKQVEVEIEMVIQKVREVIKQLEQ